MRLAQEKTVLERIVGIDEELGLASDMGRTRDFGDHGFVGTKCGCPDYSSFKESLQVDVYAQVEFFSSFER